MLSLNGIKYLNIHYSLGPITCFSKHLFNVLETPIHSQEKKKLNPDSLPLYSFYSVKQNSIENYNHLQ